MATFFWFCVITILYVYIGYPLLITLFAQLKPKPRYELQHDHNPSVTLLIAAYNEEEMLARKLENSLELDYPSDLLQILVAADGSSDRTPEIVKSMEDKGIELSYVPERGGKMAAINRAMPKVKGEIVIFSDANNLYTPNAIRELITPFVDSRVGAATGAKYIIKDERDLGSSEGLYWRYESFIKKQETRLGCSVGAVGEIFAIRRELYMTPLAGIINDDFFIATHIIKSGYRVIYRPEAKSFEPVSASAEDEVIRRTRIVAGRYQAIFMSRHLLPLRNPMVAWQIISHKFMRPLVPFAMIGAGIANIWMLIFPGNNDSMPLLSLTSPYNWIFLILQVCFYLAAIIGNYLVPGSKIRKLLYLPTFLVNSNFAALLGLYKYLRGTQTSKWQRVKRGQLPPQ